MPNTHFQRQPLDQAIQSIVTGSKKCKICVTFNENFIGEDPNYINWDVLFTTDNKSEVTKQLRLAFAIAKRYAGENCENIEIPKFEDLTESKSDRYTIFIRY